MQLRETQLLATQQSEIQAMEERHQQEKLTMLAEGEESIIEEQAEQHAASLHTALFSGSGSAPAAASQPPLLCHAVSTPPYLAAPKRPNHPGAQRQIREAQASSVLDNYDRDQLSQQLAALEHHSGMEAESLALNADDWAEVVAWGGHDTLLNG